MDACECSEKEVCVFCVAGKVDVIRDQTIRELAAGWIQADEQRVLAFEADWAEANTVKEAAAALRSLLQGGGK